MGRFVPPALVQRLAEEGVAGTARLETVHGTCMATDAAQFTLMAETMPPDALGRVMNQYYDILFAEVERHGGQVSDVVGDAMMAIWATARPDAETRRNACEAALAIRAALELRSRAGDRAALPTRIGLHAGEIQLGSVGARQHLEFRAVGDIVNTASRIEGLNKHLGTTVLVSAETLAGLHGLCTRDVGSFLLPGKSFPVAVHQLLGVGVGAGTPGGEPLSRFAEALAEFREERWTRACELFRRCQKDNPGDSVAGFYASLCEEYERRGPHSLRDGAIRIAGK
jgi:adenylate cyclase